MVKQHRKVTRRSMARRSTHARSSALLPNLDVYQSAYVKIADSGMRESLIDIPLQKFTDMYPIFVNSWQHDLMNLFSRDTSENKIKQRCRSFNKDSPMKPTKLPRKKHMVAKYKMSEWVNNRLVLTYNPTIYFYDTRFKHRLNHAPSTEIYRKELEKIDQSVEKFLKRQPTQRPSCHLSLGEMLGLPEIKQCPELRLYALARALKPRWKSNKEESGIKPLPDKPEVRLVERQKSRRSAAMLEKAFRLREQPEDVSCIPDVMKYLEKMLEVPICPTLLFQKFLNHYKPRRRMISKFSNQLAFFKEYTPTIMNRAQAMALKKKQKEELLRYLKIEKGALNQKSNDKSKNMILRL